MLLNILFWLAVSFDVAILFVVTLLGLAAAKPSHTAPLSALIVTSIVPGAILATLVLLFLRAPSRGWRLSAFVLVSLPLLITLVSQGFTHVMIRYYQDEAGNLRQFRAGPLRDIEVAIERNDVTAVMAAAQGVDVNTHSMSGTTVLGLALRQLEKTPDQLDILRALIKVGADPNAGTHELPLQAAIGLSRRTGPEPVKLLLAAGANPNTLSEFGEPVFFIAGGRDIDVEIMKILLDHGADVLARNKAGNSAIAAPVMTRNWKVLLLLLQRGTPWQHLRTPNGLPLRSYLENEARLGTDDRLTEVIKFLQTAEAQDRR